MVTTNMPESGARIGFAAETMMATSLPKTACGCQTSTARLTAGGRVTGALAVHVLVVVIVDQPVVAEAAHRLDDRQQRVALAGQLVLDARRRLGVALALDDPLLLEHVQPLGERARADPRAGVLELGEAARALRRDRGRSAPSTSSRSGRRSPRRRT